MPLVRLVGVAFWLVGVGLVVELLRLLVGVGFRLARMRLILLSVPSLLAELTELLQRFLRV